MDTIIYRSNIRDLRKAYTEVKNFIEHKTGGTIYSLHTKIENDLGLFGDDNRDLLNAFVTTYDLDATGFDYTEHFESESEIFNNGIFFVKVILLPIFFPIWICRIIPLKPSNWHTIPFYPNWGRDTADLTFADMLAWYLNKKFCHRANFLASLTKLP